MFKCKSKNKEKKLEMKKIQRVAVDNVSSAVHLLLAQLAGKSGF